MNCFASGNVRTDTHRTPGADFAEVLLLNNIHVQGKAMEFGGTVWTISSKIVIKVKNESLLAFWCMAVV